MDIPYTNYLTSIVVGEYTDVKQEWNGVQINNYGYPNETKEVAATVKNLPDMVRFFSEVTGIKYPYPNTRRPSSKNSAAAWQIFRDDDD